MSTLRMLLNRPSYVSLAVGVMWFVFSLSIWLQHWPLILQIFSTSSVLSGVTFLLSLYGSIATNFTFLSGSTVVILSFLFGINVALMVYLIRRQIDVQKGVTTNIWGMIFGVLGIGCAACGSVILTGLLSLFGGVWILAYLPLGGEELGLIGIIILSFSLYSLHKRISGPLVCKK